MSKSTVDMRVLALQLVNMLGMKVGTTVSFEAIDVKSSSLSYLLSCFASISSSIPPHYPAEIVSFDPESIIGITHKVQSFCAKIVDLPMENSVIQGNTVMGLHTHYSNHLGFHTNPPPEIDFIMDEVRSKNLRHNIVSSPFEDPFLKAFFSDNKINSTTTSEELKVLGSRFYKSFKVHAKTLSVTRMSKAIAEIALRRDKTRMQDLTKRDRNGTFDFNSEVNNLKNVNACIKVSENKASSSKKHPKNIIVGRASDALYQNSEVVLRVRDSVSNARVPSIRVDEAIAESKRKDTPILLFLDNFQRNVKSVFDKTMAAMETLDSLPEGSMASVYLKNERLSVLTTEQNEKFKTFKSLNTGMDSTPYNGIFFVFKGAEGSNPHGLSFYATTKACYLNNMSRLTIEVFSLQPPIFHALPEEIPDRKIFELAFNEPISISSASLIIANNAQRDLVRMAASTQEFKQIVSSFPDLEIELDDENGEEKQEIEEPICQEDIPWDS